MKPIEKLNYQPPIPKAERIKPLWVERKVKGYKIVVTRDG